MAVLAVGYKIVVGLIIAAGVWYGIQFIGKLYREKKQDFDAVTDMISNQIQMGKYKVDKWKQEKKKKPVEADYQEVKE